MAKYKRKRDPTIYTVAHTEYHPDRAMAILKANLGLKTNRYFRYTLVSFDTIHVYHNGEQFQATAVARYKKRKVSKVIPKWTKEARESKQKDKRDGHYRSIFSE